MIITVYFSKKAKFFKKNYLFSLFSSLFMSQTLIYYISKTANRLRLYKTFTIIYKTKTFSQKKRNKYSYKAHFKQNFGSLSKFSLYFQGFSSFLQFNSQNLETNFVSYQKKPLFLSVLLKKIELLRFVSRETSDAFVI